METLVHREKGMDQNVLPKNGNNTSQIEVTLVELDSIQSKFLTLLHILQLWWCCSGSGCAWEDGSWIWCCSCCTCWGWVVCCSLTFKWACSLCCDNKVWDRKVCPHAWQRNTRFFSWMWDKACSFSVSGSGKVLGHDAHENICPSPAWTCSCFKSRALKFESNN